MGHETPKRKQEKWVNPIPVSSVLYFTGYLGDDLSGLVDDSGVEEGGDTLPEGIYNVPRNMLVGDTPIFDPSAPGNTPIAGGIYDVPRSLLGNQTHPNVYLHIVNKLTITFLY